jgi:hypothetical protein
MSALFLSITNFINRFLIGLTAPNPRETRNQSSRGALNGRLAAGDSGFQLNLEIALSGVSAKVQSAFQPGRRCVETSDDVIKDLVQNSRHCVKSFSFLI